MAILDFNCQWACIIQANHARSFCEGLGGFEFPIILRGKREFLSAAFFSFLFFSVCVDRLRKLKKAVAIGAFFAVVCSHSSVPHMLALFQYFCCHCLQTRKLIG